MSYFAGIFGSEEPERETVVRTRQASTTTIVSPSAQTAKRIKFSDASSIAKLRCSGNDDLAEAYDTLLETFDCEQAKFQSKLRDLEKEHASKLVSVVKERDELQALVSAKQATFDSSLTQLEVKLTLLLKKRIESTFGSKVASGSQLISELEDETRQKDLDIDALRRMYDSLLARLEKQRVDHAHHVAGAAREALRAQLASANQRLTLLRSGQQCELAELQAVIDSLKHDDSKVARERVVEMEALKARQANEARVLDEELKARYTSVELELSEVSVQSTHSQLREHEETMTMLGLQLEQTYEVLDARRVVCEAGRAELQLAEERDCEEDAVLAARLASELAQRRLEWEREEELAGAELHSEFDRRRSDAVADERETARAELERLAASQVERFQECKAQLAASHKDVAAATREALETEATCAADIAVRRQIMDRQLAMAEMMAEELEGEGVAAKSMQGVTDDDDDENGTARAGGKLTEDDKLDKRMLLLRCDASALREAVAELQRTLRSEDAGHQARRGALKSQIDAKQRQVESQRAERDRGPQRDTSAPQNDDLTNLSSLGAPGGDLAAFDASTMAEWNAIIATGRAAAKIATGTTTHVTASGNEAALRARSACVVQELAAIEGELYRAQTATRQNPSASSSASARRVAILKERHLVLEREQVYLERILAPGCEVEEYDQADSSTDVDLKRPASSRPFTVKQQREMAQSVDVAIAAMEAAPFKHLNFEYDEASVLNEALAKRGLKFVDLAFPPLNEPSVCSRGDKAIKVVWRRFSEFFEEPEVFIADEGVDISPNDIKQGKLGDCWLMCALGAIAEFPAVVKQLFPSGMETFQESGLYRVRVCQGGLWTLVTVDDYVPCALDGSPVFSRANGEELWVLLIEKAMAKLSGNYYRLRGGFAAEGLCDLTGFPTFKYNFKQGVVKQRLASGELFEDFVKADKLHAIVCASTPGEDRFTEGSKGLKVPESGLVPGHAYSMRISRKVGGHKLINLRNPWGKFEWGGAWGAKDPRWTPSFIAKVAAECEIPLSEVLEGEGSFWMSYEDFAQNFAGVAVAVQQSPSGGEWHEARSRGELTVDDRADMYRLTLLKDSHVFVGVHQGDERNLGAAPDYVSIGCTVVRELGGKRYEYQASSAPTKAREVFVPPLISPDEKQDATRIWPAGSYVISAYYTVGLRQARARARRTEWPATYDRILMRPVTAEIFSRFNTSLDGMLSVGVEGEAAELLNAVGATKHSDIKALAASRSRDAGITQAEIAEWLASRNDWPQKLERLGYEPGKSNKLAPVLVASRAVAITVHADEPVTLHKVTDCPELLEEMEELAILNNSKMLPYGDLEVYVAQTSAGASVCVKNVSNDDLLVTMDASRSKNCQSHTGALVAKVLIPRNEAKIMHHLAPAKRGPWGYTYEIDWKKV